MATVVASVAPVVAERAATFYTNLDEPTQERIATGINLFGRGISTVSTIPLMLVSLIINFILLAFIFILTLYLRNRALFQAGDVAYVNYVRNAFLQGLGWALAASVTIFVIDLISGGFASLVMIAVYILAGIGMLLLSLINPSFLNDITETVEVNGEQVTRSRTSAYRFWTISFWPIFVIGMLAALGLGAATTYVSNKFSKNVLDLLASVAVTNNTGTATPVNLSNLGSLTRLISPSS
jgi:hypothetical protein